MTVLRHRLMENFSRAAQGYDARAQFQHGQTLRVFDAASMLLVPQARILDVGCGTGQFAALASAHSPQWQVMGIDIAQGMCHVASSRCQVLQADARQLPLAAESVDAVVSSLCLQWVDDLAAAFAEMARVLKPGGRAIVASLGPQTLKELRAAATVAQLPFALLPMRGQEEYREAITAAGLSVSFFEQVEETEYYPQVQALLDSMRLIGAGNSFAPSGGLMGTRRFRAMLSAYAPTSAGIPATWERLFMVLHKPS